MASSETERNLRSQPTTWHTPFSAITCGQPRVAKAIGWPELAGRIGTGRTPAM